MKKILITGTNSYVGTSFKNWVSQFPDEYTVDTISLRDENWKKKSFQDYDVVLHTVGIAHVDAKPEMESLYYEINRDLTIQAAIKSEKEGVKQFIFLSSIIVFGESSKDKKKVIISKNTEPIPNGFYGNSKLEAEKGIFPLQSDKFNVVVLRPPMIYGKNSKGNFPKLVKLSEILPIIPEIPNERSMIYITNLCEFMRLIIKNEEKGIFHPQNEEYVNTTKMMKILGEMNGKKIFSTKIFNKFIFLLSKKNNTLNKVFGTFIYDKQMSVYKDNYCIYSFKDSIKQTIR